MKNFLLATSLFFCVSAPLSLAASGFGVLAYYTYNTISQLFYPSTAESVDSRDLSPQQKLNNQMLLQAQELYDAVEKNDLIEAENLLAQQTPLLMISRGIIASSKLLLGLTAFHNVQSAQMIALFNTYNYDFEVRDSMGWTPLMRAITPKASLEIIQAFIATGKALDTGSVITGYTPLHVAAFANRPDIIELLLKAGADPKKISYDGQTPLHTAVIAKKSESIDMFRAYKVPADIRDTTGKTPRDYAREIGDPELYKALQ